MLYIACFLCGRVWSRQTFLGRSDGTIALTNCPYVVRLLRICHLFLNVHSPCSYMQLRCVTATRKMALRWKPQKCRKNTDLLPREFAVLCCICPRDSENGDLETTAGLLTLLPRRFTGIVAALLELLRYKASKTSEGVSGTGSIHMQCCMCCILAYLLV